MSTDTIRWTWAGKVSALISGDLVRRPVLQTEGALFSFIFALIKPLGVSANCCKNYYSEDTERPTFRFVFAF